MRSRSILSLMSVVLLTLGVLFAPATSSGVGATPDIPDIPLPKPDDTARFKMKVSGGQRDYEKFFRAPEADGCSLHMEGSLLEGWAFQRTTSVTMEFNKYGKRVYLQRAGRQIGDSAFATKGQLRRDATGFLKVRTGPNCATFDLPDPTTCGKTVKSPLDLRLDYSGGTITLKGSGPSAARPNPLELCGIMPIGGTSFNQLSYPFPFMLRQKGGLSARTIFGNKKHLRIELKARFLEPLNPTGYTTFTETFNGSSTLTLVRQ